jgi:hypothetical protein
MTSTELTIAEARQNPKEAQEYWFVTTNEINSDLCRIDWFVPDAFFGIERT